MGTSFAHSESYIKIFYQKSDAVDLLLPPIEFKRKKKEESQPCWSTKNEYYLKVGSHCVCVCLSLTTICLAANVKNERKKDRRNQAGLGFLLALLVVFHLSPLHCARSLEFIFGSA